MKQDEIYLPKGISINKEVKKRWAVETFRSSTEKEMYYFTIKRNHSRADVLIDSREYYVFTNKDETMRYGLSVLEDVINKKHPIDWKKER
ncbi:hypothetical protein A374_08839 [Fictibacillus macauensis ZFHKF-1]|uniref:Uncharacterized protein n=1 Tax=Fictibacillus macauensis ZFHKF-1 TaxID=1196324 RepID=I8AK45_9BACL|nr:hypothetical protein [Fictibacillus macauensis]EIT85929.1 hypothetical protein A374_08839 [Fictibacillus macauensis ZFHKF-1]